MKNDISCGFGGRTVEIYGRIVSGGRVSRIDALRLYGEPDLYLLLYLANRLREKAFGKTVKFCSIVNARSGACPENCRFCAQSARYGANAAVYPMLGTDELVSAAKAASAAGAAGFSIVTSGRSAPLVPGPVLRAIEKIAGMGMYTCASFGEISEKTARLLKKAGLKRYHHNLETSRNFFPKLCTTHSFDDRLRTLHAVKRSGLELCSGGIFGVGESASDRVDLALALRDAGVDSIPLNFLYPVKGTPLGGARPLPPLLILRTIAVYRFIFPAKDLKVCGGRERNLRDLQSWIYYAGANGSMLGNYLTTSGRPAREDLRMIRDLGLKAETCE